MFTDEKNLNIKYRHTVLIIGLVLNFYLYVNYTNHI